MLMKQLINKKSAMLLIFVLTLVLFILLTLPARVLLAKLDLTEMRPAAALTPVVGMLFGWPAAAGCAVANFICGMAAGYGISYTIFDSLLQVLYAMASYYFWRRINSERGGLEFRLNSVSRFLKFCLLLALNAVLTVICSAILARTFDIANFLSVYNFYQFLNCFDSGLVFGAPLLILGHLLNKKLKNITEGKHDKIVRFTIGERMILYSLCTGLCLCLVVGAAVYLTDKYDSTQTSISIWGRTYLFQSFALNIYLAMSLGFMRFAERKISRPIEDLARITKKYYSNEHTDEQREEMIQACEMYSKDTTEVGDLARSYISVTRDLSGYIKNLRTVMAEKERINAELTLASDIQAHMLPCIFPPFPERGEFDLYAEMHPAKEVGGDFYDFYMIGEDKLAVITADVSGKGVPAALFMVITKTMIKNYTQLGMEPAEVFTTVNRILCDGNDAGLFVTAWMGVLEISTGTLTYVNAGHNPPLLKRAGGEFEYLRARTGFVLAGMDDMVYRQNTLTINPGDRLFLYTDGVTETTDTHEQLYGEERLRSFLNSHPAADTTGLLRALLQDLKAFADGAPQFDDITMLLLDFRGKVLPMTERTFEAKTENVPAVLGFIEEELEKAGCSMKVQTAVCVAMEELFVNIASYAYREPGGTARISCGVNPDTHTATFIVADSGGAFNPLAKSDPDITLSAEDRPIGGLGILIIKKTMDSVAYSRVNGENRLTMTKHLEEGSTAK